MKVKLDRGPCMRAKTNSKSQFKSPAKPRLTSTSETSPYAAMSHLATKIEAIEKVLKDVQTLVRKYTSSCNHSSKGKAHQHQHHQPAWVSKIDGMISQLAQEIRDVKQRIEISPTDSHSFTTVNDRQHHPPEARSPTSDQPSDRQPSEQQQCHSSSGSAEDARIQGSVIMAASVGADGGPTVATQLGEVDVDEHHVPSKLPDQFRPSITVPVGLVVSQSSENAAANPKANPATQRPSSPPIAASIPYRKEGDILVLMPSDMDQCRDTTFLLAQAEALGARETGVFKYVLPDGFARGTNGVSSIKTRVSRFESHLGPDNILRISRTEDLETLNISDTDLTPIEPNEVAELLERRLHDPESVSKMRYCTDLPARSAQDRRQLGLPAKSPVWPLKDNQLDRTRYRIPGLHDPYGYVSSDDGSLFVIHKEDGGLPSVNVLHSGRGKFWCVVARKDGCLIENVVKGGKCAQRVRHASRWIPRSTLTAMGTSFVTFVQRVGEVVVVWGDSYHQGGTLGPTTAEAVNYGSSDWSIEGYSGCGPKCDGYPIPNAFLEFRASGEPQREQEEDVLQGTDKSTRFAGRQCVAKSVPPRVEGRVGTESSNRRTQFPRKRDPSLLAQTSRAKRSRTTHSSADTMTVADNDIWSAQIRQMAKAICSRIAIKQFFEIVRGRRELEPTAWRMSLKSDLLKSPELGQMLRTDIQIINLTSHKSAYHDFVTRLNQARLAQHAEDVKRSWETQIRQHRERIRRGDVKKMLKGTNMTERRFHHHRERGIEWRKYDKMFPGILGFLPFHTQTFGFSSTDWVSLRDTDFDELRLHVDNNVVSALCAAGKKFENSLDLTADEVEFVGETQVESLEKASMEDLVSFLEPVTREDENVYDENKYPDWRKPKYWPDNWTWPADPTSIPPEENQCILCDQGRCDCVQQRPEIQPRIRIYNGKGRGLQAVAREAGRIAYPKNTLLGYLTGNLAPPRTYDNGRSYAVFRTDILFEPEVAQINCDENSFWALMNHHCDPPVETRGIRVSGKYRIAIYTIRDVYDGDELTFDYGRGFWRGRDCPCSKHARGTKT